YGWIETVAPGSIHSWQIEGFADRIVRASSELAAKSDGFGVSGPLDTLAAVHSTGQVAGRRLLLIGGEAAVLLLGFAVFALAGLGGRTITVADAAAFGALGAVALALARGKADAQALAAGGGTGVVLLLLPGLVVLVAAVVFARVVTPLLRLLERAGRRGPVPL